MYTYSIVPLTESCFEDVCNDIKDQYLRRISTVPLFKMVLMPEGNPVWKKAEEQCRIYARYRDALASQGVKTGVLVQACMGHGYPLTPSPFQRYIQFTDGAETYSYCPEDPAFVEHFKDVMRQIAKEHPSAIMLDDDVRLMMRPGRGCACPLHMTKFNQLTGHDMTREELWEYVQSHPDNDPLTLKFIEIQQNSLVHFVTQLREAIDSVDPAIQGINCTSGDECDSVIYTNPIFAGKGNPTIVRVPNGTYAPETVKGFSDTMRRAAVCGSKLKKHGIDIILAETDTVPFNRYAKNSRYLHAHYTASILEGLMGAKHWITRFSDHELNSGRAFRDILAKHAPFYEQLSEMVKGIRWTGANSLFIEQEHHAFSKPEIWRYHNNAWTSCVLERMGIPFFFSDENTGAAFLEDDIVRDMTDEQIQNLFRGSVFAASDAAADLVNRGYGDLLGVKITSADGVYISGETFDGTSNSVCTKQKNLKLLHPTNDKIEVLSYNYAKERAHAKLVSPAVTLYQRDDNNLSVVYCGIPKAQFNYVEGFAFLNESRKRQFISLLTRAGVLPVYYPGDNEICLRAGYLADGRLLTAVFDLGYDPMDTMELYLEKAPTHITLLMPDGSESDVSWQVADNNIYSVEVKVEPLYPVILLIS